MHAKPTYDALGELCGLHRCSVESNIKEVANVLGDVVGDRFSWGKKSRGKLPTTQAVVQAFPEINKLFELEAPMLTINRQ